jgi:orotidine-5'-phosphate decarboxylase
MDHFADRLIASTRRLSTPLCVGFDPFPELIPPIFGSIGSIDAMESFFGEVIDRLANRVGVVKPQIGLFEPWGSEGFALVARLSAQARERELLVILDAKRGDIGSTAQGYARAYLAHDAQISCDCITINPYLGLDSLKPFADVAEQNGKGIAVLVRTSNPGAQDFQDLLVDGAPLWTRVAEKLSGFESRLLGASGFSSLMVVCGATWPHEAKRLRAILPQSVFLVPGYGAQGAGAHDALAGFVAGPNGVEGGVVSSSRGVLYPAGGLEATTLAQWRAIFDDCLDKALSDLRAASNIDV